MEVVVDAKFLQTSCGSFCRAGASLDEMVNLGPPSLLNGYWKSLQHVYFIISHNACNESSGLPCRSILLGCA